MADKKIWRSFYPQRQKGGGWLVTEHRGLLDTDTAYTTYAEMRAHVERLLDEGEPGKETE